MISCLTFPHLSCEWLSAVLHSRGTLDAERPTKQRQLRDRIQLTWVQVLLYPKPCAIHSRSLRYARNLSKADLCTGRLMQKRIALCDAHDTWTRLLRQARQPLALQTNFRQRLLLAR